MKTPSTSSNHMLRELTENEIKAISGGRKQWVKLVLHVLEYVLHANDITKHKPERKHSLR